MGINITASVVPFAAINAVVVLLAAASMFILGGRLVTADVSFNYKEALTKSIIFLEAQRSGKLPPNKRLSWRGDSGMDDGKLDNVDLVGGYYDAGDNVKYGMPMAFTVTTLSWTAIFYHSQLEAAGELLNVQDAIRWGTDFFLKACSKRDTLYVQVGNPITDHQCWVRPENMKTERTLYKIDKNQPGTELAAETSAALASASIVFRKTDHEYSHTLLNKAKTLFKFARTHKGTYDGECPFYCSFSGSNDELQWAATWLYKATRNETYRNFILEEAIDGTVSEFNWDLKYAGTQVLLTQMFFEGDKELDDYQRQVDSFICSVLPESPYHQVHMTPGGLVYMRDGANTQYATSAAFLFSVYGDLLAGHNQQVSCGNQKFGAAQLLAFAKKQMDYILGDNPQQRSYMVGFGKNPPQQAHHRGASVPVLSPNEVVNCGLSFLNWFVKDAPNPNELTGAIVGGPDCNDNFEDRRYKSNMEEPTTYINSAAVGVLARLASPHQ